MTGGGACDDKTTFQSAKNAPIAAMTMNTVMIGWLFIFSRKSVFTAVALSVSSDHAEVQIYSLPFASRLARKAPDLAGKAPF